MRPVVYRFWAGETLLYIGQTVDFARRVDEHATNQRWWPWVTWFSQEPHPTVAAAIAAESAAIRSEQPVFNIAGNDQGANERRRLFWAEHGQQPRAGYYPAHDRVIRQYTARYGTCLPLSMTMPSFITELHRAA